MKRLLWIGILLLITTLPVSAALPEAPVVPEQAEDYMPDPSNGFGQGIWHIFITALQQIGPDIAASSKVCLGVIAAVLLMSFLRDMDGKSKLAADLAAVTTISALLLHGTGSVISLATETVQQVSQYGKMLLPVMTAALASEGGTVTSAAIYTGTAIFDALLSTAISSLLIPVVYLYLAFGIMDTATEEKTLKGMIQFVKWLMTWILKTILYIFTGYIGITGVISGTTDRAALKATKLAISGVVPVVGNILSDASETILVSAGLLKNTAGIYGLLAVLAITIGPFLKIGVQFLLLKLTAGLCGMIGDGKYRELIDCFCGAMGMLLAMTGSSCILQLVSTVCFMKGIH